MISDMTKRAIAALLAADGGVTLKERDAVLGALASGDRSNSCVRFADAASMIGCHVNTIRNLVKRGLLTPVSSGNRSIGVTRESMSRMFNNK